MTHRSPTTLLFSACSMLMAPLIAVLEGCNQVAQVNRYRVFQAITGSLVVWTCLVSGANLWTPVFAVLVQFAWEFLLLQRRYGRMIIQLMRTAGGPFQWRKEIWPLQWRVGIQSAARFLAFFPLIPTLFAAQGPETAGQMGITWQVLSNLSLVAYAWIRTRAPEFGQLIADGRCQESRREFVTATGGSTLLLVALMAGFWVALVALGQAPLAMATQIANRFLDTTTLIWFAIALIPLHLTQCLSLYIRSQKMDPLWRVSVPANLILAVLVYVMASRVGVAAVGMVMLVAFSIVAVLIYWIWRKYDHLMQAVDRN